MVNLPVTNIRLHHSVKKKKTTPRKEGTVLCSSLSLELSVIYVFNIPDLAIALSWTIKVLSLISFCRHTFTYCCSLQTAAYLHQHLHFLHLVNALAPGFTDLNL